MRASAGLSPLAGLVILGARFPGPLRAGLIHAAPAALPLPYARANSAARSNAPSK